MVDCTVVATGHRSPTPAGRPLRLFPTLQDPSPKVCPTPVVKELTIFVRRHETASRRDAEGAGRPPQEVRRPILDTPFIVRHATNPEREILVVPCFAFLNGGA